MGKGELLETASDSKEDFKSNFPNVRTEKSKHVCEGNNAEPVEVRSHSS